MLDSQGNIDVGFKPSKKMKKRRELDALVGSVKTRRKTKNGHELLRTESESSDVDEFFIANRKSFVRQGKISCCATCMSVYGFFMVVTCFICICALIYLHLQMKENVEKIREEVNKVKGSSLQTSVDDIKQQILNSIKKDLVNVTHGSIEMGDVKKRLASLGTKVDTLSSSIEAVSQSQPGSKQVVEEVKTISTQIPVISKTVGNLGVDVKSMKSEVEKLKDFQKKAEQELDELKLQKNPEAASAGRESGGQETSHVDNQDADITNKLQNFGEAIHLVNNSLSSEISKLQSTLSSHEVYISALQNITANLQRDLKVLSSDHSSIQNDHKMMDQGAGEGTEQTKLLIHQVIEDMGLANQTSSSQSLDSLSVKIDSITATVGTLRDQFRMMKDKQEGIDSQDFGTIQINLHTLNKSVEVLKLDFHTLMNKVSQQSSLLTSLNKTVEMLQHFSASIDKDHKAMISDLGPIPTAGLKTPSEVKETVKTPTTQSPTPIHKGKTESETIPTAISTKSPFLSTKGISSGNQPPVAKTEGRVTVLLPVKEIYLNGTSSTDDKEVMLYHWEQKGGPTSLLMSYEDEAIATATGNFLAGQYVFELQVWDDEGLSSKMKLYVDVKDANPGNVRSTTIVPDLTAAPALHKYIDMSLVKKYEDLELGVRRWDKDGDGFVNPQDLPDYMPDAPTKEQLEKFDFNHDGLYSVDELAVALGFKPWPKDQPEPPEEQIH